MSTVSQHTEWLSLIDVSGPFLAIPVLERAFPQGLDVVETPQRQRLRQAYDEWRDSVDADDPELAGIHEAWIRMVLEEILEFDAEVMKPTDELPESLAYVAPEHGVVSRPDLAILAPDAEGMKARLLIGIYPPETDLEELPKGDTWPASPAERMTLLCRATGVRLGLLTDGERWMLVDAPVGATAGYASWYARLWSQEPVTLRAFQSLLGVRRFFGPRDETLEVLLESSLEHQEEVTDKLGEQVRRAVEVLVQALDRADIDRNRELLHDVTPSELYEAGLTVMMRLVFLLCAEERGLLLLGDSGYDQNYAISPLRAQLREEADRVGLEVLERRQDAWSRLLAVFRAVYGGIEHESLRMPALGGSLFDPDRFPFLEGRSKGTGWRETSAIPLPIDNHTVLMLLDALQVLEQRGGAQLLSYRALDVEQIGYVYEGLLEHTVTRLPRTTLGLVGSSKVKNPNVELAELESVGLEGEDALIETLVERTGRSKSALGKALRKSLEDDDYGRLLLACAGDRELADRTRPYAHLLRTDNWGQPLVYEASSFAVTFGADRRETGTHYTPKSLTEAIVTETLEPVAYVGPAEGEARENWRLKSSEELLDLKVCDPAMGSGAFLVQACRWLSERLLEAWQDEERAGKCLRIDGKALDSLEGGEPLPRDAEERLLVARRLIAERCLYGVDINPMAVELAKLSIWLVTLAKGRPFGFLDHNLRSGDSLLGIHDLDQLRSLDMDPNRAGSGRKLFAQAIDQAADVAVELRKRLRQRVILDIHDVEAMAELDKEARRKLELPELIADALVGEVLAAGGKEVDTAALSIEVGQAIEGNNEAIDALRRKARTRLSTDLPSGKALRHPMHWPLEFPEVFVRDNAGFDSMIGNPPFLGGKRLTSFAGESYRNWIVSVVANGKRGAADLSAYFYLRTNGLLGTNGCAGMIATDSIADGDNRLVGLRQIIESGSTIYRAVRSMPWPGTAAVSISVVWWAKSTWLGLRILGADEVDEISDELKIDETGGWEPRKLKSDICESFAGTYINGEGFLIGPEEAERLISSDPKNKDVLYPYLTGDDVNTQTEQTATRWVINFHTMPLKEAQGYADCFEIVAERVKPYRESLTKQIHEADFWKFWDKRLASYEKIKNFSRVLVAARAAKDVQLTWVPNGQVFSDQLVVFVTESDGVFALLQSSIHRAWAWSRCTGMWGAGIRYAPSKAVSTFVIPIGDSDLDNLGLQYFMCRRAIEKERSIGLTTLYNIFHDPVINDSDVLQLRELHRQIDQAVAGAYGWTDLDLNHDFHEFDYLPENDRVRFTISEKARIEVLRRLSLLNKERYEEEVAQGLHSKKGTAKKKTATRKKRKQAKVYEIPSYSERDIPKAAEPPSPQMDIFSSSSGLQPSEQKGNQWGSEPIDQVLAWLEAHPGWHSKDAVLKGCGADYEKWGGTIKELQEEGFIETRADNSSEMYRAKE